MQCYRWNLVYVSLLTHCTDIQYLATCVEGPDVSVHYDACKGCNCTSAEECMDPAICPCAKLNQSMPFLPQVVHAD